MEGNALYIQGKLEEGECSASATNNTDGLGIKAIEKYVEAITMDDKDPAPLRTLSSANFELGDYNKCLETIADALKLEKDHTKILGLRLREAKCYFYKRRFSEAEDILLEHCNLEDTEAQQLYKAIEEYMRFPRDDAGWEEVLKIPRIRPNLTPHLTTFFTRGHDDPVAPFSDKDLARLAAKGPLNMDIFHGGIGDGRHLFQQLNHIYAYGKKLSISAPDKLAVMRGNFSFVVQDIKPEVMARLLVILCLLYQTSDAMRIGDDREQRFLEMVIVYVYACDIMPPYCETHMLGVIRDLIQSANTGNNFGIPWLSVDEESKDKICEVLRFWLEDHSDLPGIDFDVESAQDWYINGLTDDALSQVKKLGPEALEELRQFSTTRMLFPLQELIDEREPVLAKLISKKPLNISVSLRSSLKLSGLGKLLTTPTENCSLWKENLANECYAATKPRLPQIHQQDIWRDHSTKVSTYWRLCPRDLERGNRPTPNQTATHSAKDGLGASKKRDQILPDAVYHAMVCTMCSSLQK